ncbi:hypothetical protein H2198_008209 [Neophaeococcomyces mojaviensis]|uniref:Uncharacterized protein n=1 Tax=Neophaeococcomyces mojaviensis TaxID=3383035 RepID=A0ACC2ZXR3_9EURO|nr:hypothetical protein H2198_008209 [Knufia sp. JES_112]
MSIQPAQATAASSNMAAAPPSEASTKLAEAIDDFLGDVEKKFKNISDEILSKRELRGTLPPKLSLIDEETNHW